MTVFSTLCCASAAPPEAAVAPRPRRGVAYLARCLLLILLGLPGWAQAGRIEPLEASLSVGEDAYLLSAQFRIELGSHLEEAVSRGVPLYFLMEFELTRNRWYWSNEHIAGRTINYRLAYNALTRQYRLSNGGLHQNFASLEDALRVLARIAELPVADKALLKLGEPYQAALRLSLDRQQLPKPFQVDAIANRDWQVETTAQKWVFVPASASGEGQGK